MSFILVQILTGLSNAASLFLVASGLSIIFGVTRIVNFAHGSFYMLGAYLALTIANYPIAGRIGDTLTGFALSVMAAAAVVAILGAIIEMTVLRRIYRAPELFQLAATFGIVLIVQDVALAVWGPFDVLGPRAPGLDGAVAIGGHYIPEYDLALVALAPLVLAGLWLLFYRTRWGIIVRGATEDREIVAALGVNQTWIFTGVFALGSFLAGLGGAVRVPREPVSLLMDLNIIAEVFVVVVVGGMGSILGSFLAAVLIGQLKVFGILILPEITLVLVFLVMMVVLVLRPQGLMGRPEPTAHGGGHGEERPLAPAGPRLRLVLFAVAAMLLMLPVVADRFTLVLMTEILIFALFAASLHFIMGGGGMVSFGHAAYFGLGAYGAGLAVVHLAAPMEVALVLAPLLSGAGGLLFGWFCVRLSGVYLAMLSLAFAQITWSIALQWHAVTGGDDGLVGVWPSAWASQPAAYYYLTLALCGSGVLSLRRLFFTPFGMALRAGRDSPLRADAVGIDVRRQQWLAFAIAGAMAGLAGGLYAFSKGSVFPDELAIPRSVDALLMVLLGGVQTLSGPIVGAFAFVGLEDWLARLAYWRLILGLAIVGICVLMPKGVVGAAVDLTGDRDRPPAS
ncbi:MAG: ABC transporter permease [Rhodospirillales bacterium]|nr:ABC transporter permease [Rhodospirillales bacterium]